MYKERLRTPGPTEIPANVYQAMFAPHLHHRSAEFRELFAKVREGMRWLMDSEEPPVFLASSGTGAMEAALRNLCSSGDKVVVAHAGKFGERFLQISAKLGLDVVSVEAAWDKALSAEQIGNAVQQNPEVRLVCLQCSETSTGVIHPVSQIGAAVKSANAECLLVVDAISALGTLPISAKRDQIDVLIAASQKALMLPPGLAMLALSSLARSKLLEADSYYFDLRKELGHQSENSSAWTPAISIILGLAEVLRMLRAEGLEAVFKRHRRMSQVVRAALSEMGCELLAECSPSPGLTPAKPPAGVAVDDLRKELRECSGIQIAGAQDSYKGKVFRVGHMGYPDEFDMIAVVAAIELVVAKLSGQAADGRAVAAGLRALQE